MSSKILDQLDLRGRINVVIGSRGLLGKIAVATIKELGGECLELDLPDFDLLDPTTYPHLDQAPHGVINCAIGNQIAVKSPQDAMSRDLEIGLAGAAYAMELFKPRPGGVFVNVGSDLSFKAPAPARYHPNFKPLSYSIVKFGVLGLTKYYAAIWGPENIRCNTLCPGGIEQGQAKPYCPLARLARPEELKAPIAFLMSDASSYMTGAELRVDGGSTCW